MQYVDKIHKYMGGGTSRPLKRGISLFLSLLLIVGIFTALPLSANARAPIVIDHRDDSMLTWNISNNVLTIDGDELFDKTENVRPTDTGYWRANRDTITKIIINNTITQIGNYSFYNFPNLVEVDLPSSLTNIGEYAFANCTKLETYTIPDGCTVADTAFEGCPSTPTQPTTIGDNLSWSFNNGTLTISGTGVMNDFTSSQTPLWNEYLSDITNIVIENGVTSIGNYVFKDCPNLTNITIPNSVTSIGNGAFKDCTSLSKPTIPNGCTVSDTAFNGCPFGSCGENLTWVYDGNGTLIISGSGNMTNFSEHDSPWYNYRNNITNVELPNGLTSIGNYAFYTCRNLTSIDIPDSVEAIGDYAFKGCNSLSKPTIPNGCTVSDTAFNGCPFGSCGENLTWVYDGNGTLIISGSGNMTNFSEHDSPWYNYRNNITNVELPNGLTSIGNYAFYTCRNLTSIDIPDSVEAIGDYAFKGCNSLSKPTIPNGCTVSDTAFNGCPFGSCGENLTWVYDGNGTLIISGSGNMTNFSEHDSPWYNYRNNITNVELPNGLTSIGNYAFYTCRNLTSIDIPDSVEAIGDYAFKGCNSLSKPTIPDGCTVSDTAFNGWLYNSQTKTLYIDNSISKSELDEYRLDIKNVVIAEGVTSVGKCLFANCFNLETVTLPSTLETLNVATFINCINLKHIDISNVINIPHECFMYCQSLKSIRIPDKCKVDHLAFFGCTNLTIDITSNLGADNTTRYWDYSCESNPYMCKMTNKETQKVYYVSKLVGVNSNVASTIKSQYNIEQIADLSDLERNTNIDSIRQSKIDELELNNNLKNQPCDGYWTNFLGAKQVVLYEDSKVVPMTSSNYEGTPSNYSIYEDLLTARQYYKAAVSSNYDTLKDLPAFDIPKLILKRHSNNQQNSSIISTGKKSSLKSTGIKNNRKISVKLNNNYSAYLYSDEVIENFIESQKTVSYYIMESMELSEAMNMKYADNIKLHLNGFQYDQYNNPVIDENGNLVDGSECYVTKNANDKVCTISKNVTIMTPGEALSGILNDEGTLFDIKEGCSLRIENGTYSEDVSEYIANNQVIGKNTACNRYTVLKAHTEDLELESDGHKVIMPNNQETFAREDFVGVQMRRQTDTISEGMRFVSVVRSDILRGAEDYGYVLVKGRNYDNMVANKANIYAGSNGCKTVSLKNTKNTLADNTHSSANLGEGKYKYLTAAITDITDNNSSIGARFYIKRADGTYVYSDYTCVCTMGMLKSMSS